MIKYLITFFLFYWNPLLAQTKDSGACKVEIYLLKNSIQGSDTIRKKDKALIPLKEDLADTPFIKDEEFISYTIIIAKIKDKGRKRYFRYRHRIEVRNPLDARIEQLDLPVKLGKQFALVINGEIIYGGYILWRYGSAVPPYGICASAFENKIHIQCVESGEIPKNKLKDLMDCFRRSKGLFLIKEKYDRHMIMKKKRYRK